MKVHASRVSQANTLKSDSRLFPRVFSWMVAGLLMTAIIAYVLGSNPRVTGYLAANPLVFGGFVIAELLTVLVLSFLFHRLSVFAATFAFFLYAALNGVTLTLVFSMFELGTIASAFFIAAGMFGIFAFFGVFTKIDLSKIGFIALMLVIGLVLASVVNLFFLKNGWVNLVISYAMVILFSIITAWDVQKIKQLSREKKDEDTTSKLAILGALMLYLDFIIIFKNVLFILGNDD